MTDFWSSTPDEVWLKSRRLSKVPGNFQYVDTSVTFERQAFDGLLVPEFNTVRPKICPLRAFDHFCVWRGKPGGSVRGAVLSIR